MNCKLCGSNSKMVFKFGFFIRGKTQKKIQRYRCRSCRKTFCGSTCTPFYRMRKRVLFNKIFVDLCSGMSQRRMARRFGVAQSTIARLIDRVSKLSNQKTKKFAFVQGTISNLQFDEMETFEHTKCKPLSIIVAFDRKYRVMVYSRVCRMPAKGLLAEIAREKYGYRKDDRRIYLKAMMKNLKPWINKSTEIESDECPRYRSILKKYYPENHHEAHKGRRGCVVGQGELKAGGHDPLFTLNHGCAMVRDNIKRLSRRTWCTTKKPRMLQKILDIYRWFQIQLVLATDKSIPNLYLNPFELNPAAG